jgi:hypothetical protein
MQRSWFNTDSSGRGHPALSPPLRSVLPRRDRERTQFKRCWPLAAHGARTMASLARQWHERAGRAIGAVEDYAFFTKQALSAKDAPSILQSIS